MLVGFFSASSTPTDKFVGWRQATQDDIDKIANGNGPSKDGDITFKEGDWIAEFQWPGETKDEKVTWTGFHTKDSLEKELGDLNQKMEFLRDQKDKISEDEDYDPEAWDINDISLREAESNFTKYFDVLDAYRELNRPSEGVTPSKDGPNI